MRHPALLFANNGGGEGVIANDIHLGGDQAEGNDATMMLLTGPNMGGKVSWSASTVIYLVRCDIAVFQERHSALSSALTCLDSALSLLDSLARLL